MIDQRETERFHVIVDPQPEDGGKYVVRISQIKFKQYFAYFTIVSNCFFKLCYDFSDSVDENKYTGATFEDVKNDLHRDHADFCRFYEKSFLDTGNLMGLLFIPILLLLALIIYCIWKHCCAKDEGEGKSSFWRLFINLSRRRRRKM